MRKLWPFVGIAVAVAAGVAVAPYFWWAIGIGAAWIIFSVCYVLVVRSGAKLWQRFTS